MHEHRIRSAFQQKIHHRLSATKIANSQLRDALGKEWAIKQNAPAFSLHCNPKAGLENEERSGGSPGLGRAGHWVKSRALGRAALQTAEQLGEPVKFHLAA